MNDSSGLPFERELRITRAKDSGLVAYIDGANEPSIAWSDERDFVSWQQRHLPASRSSVADHETSVDEIVESLNRKGQTGEVVDLQQPNTANIGRRFGFTRGK